MTVRLAFDNETRHWDERILANPDGGNIFQSLELAEQKRLGGWRPRLIMAGNTAVTALEKDVPLLGKLWYLPKGPGVTTVRELDEQLSGLRQLAAKNNVFCVKMEPELLKNDETLADLMKLGLAAVRPIQPNVSTVLVDISDDLETVLNRLPQKGRHAIRRAERDGVTVEQADATDENCQTMYGLLADTAAGSFPIRGYNYYKTFWQRFSRAGYGQLFFAYFEGKVVAGAYALVFGEKSTYKDGASIRKRTAYGASHLLQWHVIKWAKRKGSFVHDLCGAPPSDKINDPSHPHHGIGRFKTSFSKQVTDYVGAYDLVVKPRAYSWWQKIGERLVLRAHQQIYHENWY